MTITNVGNNSDLVLTKDNSYFILMGYGCQWGLEKEKNDHVTKELYCIKRKAYCTLFNVYGYKQNQKVQYSLHVVPSSNHLSMCYNGSYVNQSEKYTKQYIIV